MERNIAKDLGRLGIIGNGSWGTALAKMLTDNGTEIAWWLRNEEAVAHMQTRHHNPTYLSSVRFEPGLIHPTSDLPAMLADCDSVVFAVPSAYAEEVLAAAPPADWKRLNIISAIKGVLPGCGRLLNDHLHQEWGFEMEQYGAITGPCHAEEVAQERLSYLTFSSLDLGLAEGAANAFRTDFVRTNFNNDVWGTQFAAVLKNIYAVGAGMAHGLDYGDNFLAVYITACYREMYQFLKAHFAKKHSGDAEPDFHTSPYLGDLLVTCYSLHSRNRAFGNMLGKGYSVKSAQLEMNMVAEGYYASRGMQQVSDKMGLPLPIATALYKAMWEGASPRVAFKELEGELS